MGVEKWPRKSGELPLHVELLPTRYANIQTSLPKNLTVSSFVSPWKSRSRDFGVIGRAAFWIVTLTYARQFNQQRNAASLGIRCRWGMRNGIFHVAKEEGSDEVLGVACWLKPQSAGQPPSWHDWVEGWRLWFNQVGMNILYYGRGGLNVKVSSTNRNREVKSPLVKENPLSADLAAWYGFSKYPH